MKIMADVKCYHCSYVSGELIGERNGDLRAEYFHPSPSYTRQLPRGGDILRCGRCDGPVYLEDVRHYQPRIMEPIPTARSVRPQREKQLARDSGITIPVPVEGDFGTNPYPEV